MSAGRIASLDLIRGVAVMGILVANLPAFGLPEAAYFSPLAWGGTAPADLVAWFATFVLIEGKMRGLFSFLFGASLLLVADRAGDDAAGVHYRRMAVLFAIGCAHLYLLWWGDILAHYALVGSIAFFFRGMSARKLVALGLVFVAIQTASDTMLWQQALWAAPRATPQQVAFWDGLAAGFGVPPVHDLRVEIAAIGGGWADGVAYRWRTATDPFTFLLYGSPETLGYMLLGMAGLRSGFLSGSWSRTAYARVAAWTVPLCWLAYALLALTTWRSGFAVPQVIFASLVAATPIRPFLIAGYAAAIILLARPDGRWTARVEAVGRTAFTNYLGTSLVMSAIFAGWGGGQFATWSRGSLYLLAPLAWAVMLVWSRPWLSRYRYGPLEWIWRSLARGERQPMRRAARTHPASG